MPLIVILLSIAMTFITVIAFTNMTAKKAETSRICEQICDDNRKFGEPLKYKVGDIISLNFLTNRIFSLRLLLITDRSSYGEKIMAVKELLQEGNIDIVVMLGDHHDHDIEFIRECNPNMKIAGVLGNHDGFDFLKRNDVEDINGKVCKVKELRIAGMQGSFKYKDVDYPSFTQKGYVTLLV